RWYPARAPWPDAPRPRESAWRSSAWCPAACVRAHGCAVSAGPRTSAGQAEQKIHRPLVGVGKLIAVELGRRHPSEIAHAPRHQPVLLEPRRIQHQLDRITDVFVSALAHLLADLDVGIEPFFELPAQRGAIVLTGFHAAAGELPQHGKYGA